MTEKIRDAYNENYANIVNKPQIVLYNGFDPEEFEGAVPVKEADTLTITHAGHIYGSRDPLPLINALKNLLDENADKYSRIKIIFIGKVDKNVKAKIQKQKTMLNVIFLDSVSHSFVLQYMRNSTVNLIITHTGGGSSYAIPGKLFEYMGAARPVLALTDDPLTIKTVLSNKMGRVCSNTVNDISDALRVVFDEWEEGKLNENIAVNNEYNRAEITLKLDEFLRSVEYDYVDNK